MANQAKHTMHGKSSTSKYYNSLLEKRLVHFKDYFDICYAEEVARDYLSGTDNIQALAKRLKLSSKEASFLIRKGAIYRFNNDDFAAFFTKLTNQYQNSSNLPIVTSKIQKWRSEAEAIVERIDTIEEQLKSFEQTASSADEQEGLLQSLQDSLNSARKELLLKAMSAE